jgi:hypothetical protein
MSYENTKCPCGGNKPAGTMLCDDCIATLADRREVKDYQDGTLPLEYRRSAAIILCSLSRRRLNLKTQTVAAMPNVES